MTQLDYTFERQLELERNEAWKEGYKEGLDEARKEGILEVRLNFVRNVMKTLNYSATQAMDALMIAEEERKVLFERL